MRQASASASGGTLSVARHAGIDGLTVLTVYLVLLFAIPSNLAITALGSAGRPASLWALAATVWWCWHQLQRHSPSGAGVQLVRIALFTFLSVALLGYALAMLRGLPGDEINPADNGLLRLASWAGILLVANDGLASPDDLRRLLRRFAWAGGLLATLGILQFATGSSLIDWISIPGMSSTGDPTGLEARGGFTRAAATAINPLEYAVVLCMAFPIALALAMESRPGNRLVSWLPVATIAVASVLSVSRSALIGLLAGAIVLVPTFSRRATAIAGAAAAGLLVAVAVLVPGMIGTIRGLFSGLVNDPSALSRTSSYDAALELLGRFPLVGKGFGTLLARYHIFDNQYLLLAIELGIIGTLAFLVLLAAAAVSAARARVGAPSALDRQLCQALIASTVAGGVLMAVFDGLSFPMSAGTLFLVLGLCGGAMRLLAPPGSAQPIPTR